MTLCSWAPMYGDGMSVPRTRKGEESFEPIVKEQLTTFQLRRNPTKQKVNKEDRGNAQEPVITCSGPSRVSMRFPTEAPYSSCGWHSDRGSNKFSELLSEGTSAQGTRHMSQLVRKLSGKSGRGKLYGWETALLYDSSVGPTRGAKNSKTAELQILDAILQVARR
jgi:hypothetical protein